MERYTVTIAIDGAKNRPQLFIPLLCSQPVSVLLREVRRRASKYSFYFLDVEVVLHLGKVDGPILDDDDILQEVVPDAANVPLFAITSDVEGAQAHTPHLSLVSSTVPEIPLHIFAAAQNPSLASDSQNQVTAPKGKGFKIRVLTPAIAKAYEHIGDIPLLYGGTAVPGSETIYHLKSTIAKSLVNVERAPRFTILDLHTFKGPIETSDPSLTLDQADFGGCTVNGVLNLYVVLRSSHSSPFTKAGRTAIYEASECWEVPSIQSERGVAAFLSSLTVFAELVNAKMMDRGQQDAVLKTVDMLTRFPPALLTVCLLMNEETPWPSQCAALVQALFETLKDIVALDVVDGDESRIMEGSRLLFGFILATATQQDFLSEQQNASEDDLFPCFSSTQREVLINAVNTPPTERLVSKSSASLKENHLQAYTSGGTSESSSSGSPPVEMASSSRTQRFIIRELLNIVRQKQLVSFSADLSSWMLRSLGLLCEYSDLTVVLAYNLPFTEAPVLTLDRGGQLAVYVGRQDYSAELGKGVIMFRPTQGGPEIVDVSNITHTGVPVVQLRPNGGSCVFDSHGYKDLAHPEEHLAVFFFDSAVKWDWLDSVKQHTSKSMEELCQRILRGLKLSLQRKGALTEGIKVL